MSREPGPVKSGPQRPAGILAPAGDDATLVAAIRQLRGQGEIVVVDLGMVEGESGCDRKLVQTSAGWQVEPLA